MTDHPTAPGRSAQGVAAFLRRYALRYVPLYALGVAALVATNYIGVLIPEYIKHTIDAISADEPSGNWLGYVGLLLGLAVAIIGVRTLSRVLFFNPGRTVEYRLKNDYFAHLLDMAPAFFQRWRTGELISRATNDMQSVRAVIGFASLQVFNVALSLVLVLGKMIGIHAGLTLACLVPFSVAAVILRASIRHLLVRYKRAQEQLAGLSDTIMDSYSGAAVIQAFNAQGTFAARFDAANEAYRDNTIGMAFLRAFALPIVAVVGNGCLFLLLLVGGRLAVEGALTIGDIAALAAYVSIVVAALNSLGWVINAIQRGLVSLARVQEVMAEPPPPRPEEAAPPLGALGIEARGLTFQWPEELRAGEQGRSGPVLDGVSFRLEPGQTLGIFGPTGAGKTTLVNLLVRLLDPPIGAVSIGGRDVLAWPREALREAVTVVPQDAYLFSRSIRENVGFTDLPAEIDDARVERAVRLACLADEVPRLADGLQTVVGERGVTLSGGQRQRVALARAFYREPRVLVLDDVLSAVDHATEEQLIANIREVSAGVTTVIVSHRISALRHADKVLVLVDGRVVARGTHDELVARPGLYADTWRYQQEEEDEELQAVGGAHG
ncbi:MAG: ABC transporter ATP-binding protein [Myxococcales bacterium]